MVLQPWICSLHVISLVLCLCCFFTTVFAFAVDFADFEISQATQEPKRLLPKAGNDLMSGRSKCVSTLFSQFCFFFHFLLLGRCFFDCASFYRLCWLVPSVTDPETVDKYHPREMSFHFVSDIPTDILVSVAKCYKDHKIICRTCFFDSLDGQCAVNEMCLCVCVCMYEFSKMC